MNYYLALSWQKLYLRTFQTNPRSAVAPALIPTLTLTHHACTTAMAMVGGLALKAAYNRDMGGKSHAQPRTAPATFADAVSAAALSPRLADLCADLELAGLDPGLASTLSITELREVLPGTTVGECARLRRACGGAVPQGPHAADGADRAGVTAGGATDNSQHDLGPGRGGEPGSWSPWWFVPLAFAEVAGDSDRLRVNLTILCVHAPGTFLERAVVLCGVPSAAGNVCACQQGQPAPLPRQLLRPSRPSAVGSSWGLLALADAHGLTCACCQPPMLLALQPCHTARSQKKKVRVCDGGQQSPRHHRRGWVLPAAALRPGRRETPLAKRCAADPRHPVLRRRASCDAWCVEGGGRTSHGLRPAQPLLVPPGRDGLEWNHARTHAASVRCASPDHWWLPDGPAHGVCTTCCPRPCE